MPVIITREVNYDPWLKASTGVPETHPLRIVRNYCVLCQLLGPHSFNMMLNKLLYILQSPALINHSFSAFPPSPQAKLLPCVPRCSALTPLESSHPGLSVSSASPLPLLYSIPCVRATRTPRYSFLSATVATPESPAR